jgi:hypothetical protein
MSFTLGGGSLCRHSRLVLFVRRGGYSALG